MRTVVFALICIMPAAISAAPAISELRPLLLESFETESDGWSLVLNRGAEATMNTVDDAVLGSKSVLVTPGRLCAPDDRELVTNIHLRYEQLALKAQTSYVLSVWARSSGPRLLRLRVRRLEAEESVGSQPLQIDSQWRRLDFAFELPADYPDAVPQIMIADSTLPVWIDAVTISERADDLYPADYLSFGDAISGPPASLVRFATDFDDEAHGWQLQLNRGAQASVGWEAGEGCLRVTPQALCSPDDQPFETNIHLKYDALSLAADADYVYSVRLRSDAERKVGLRLRSADGGASVSIATLDVGPEWQSFEVPFRLDEAMPQAIMQVLLGGELSPVWVDDIIVREADCGDAPGEGVIGRGNLWLRPQTIAAGAAGAQAGMAELVTGLPESFRLRLAVDMFGSRSVSVALRNGDGAATVEIGDEVVLRDAAGNDLLRAAIVADEWSPGDAVTLTIERIDGVPRVIIGERHELLLGDISFGSVLLGAASGSIRMLAAEGYEMLSADRPDGSTERESFTDPVTGRPVLRLTHSAYNDKHAYYDISPWSPDGSKIVFSSALPGRNDAAIYVMDADGTNIRQVATGSGFGMHTGAFPIWAPDGESIYYHTRWTDEAGEPRSGTARAWLDSGTVDHIPSGVRQISWATGDLLWMENRVDSPVERGLYASEGDGSSVRLLAGTADISALSPSRDMHGQCERLGLTNCKWSPDGERAMVVLVGYDARGSQLVKEIYTVGADGKDLTFVMAFNHHHIWHPDSRQIIANCADGLYIVDWDGSGRRKVSDLAQGHPSFNPDGSMIVTDCYSGEYADMLVLIDPQTGEVQPLASVPTVHGRSHETGTHPHPCWSPDGKSVIYDSDQEGHCQLYQVFVE
ncbi:MAG: hypothetical protein GX131_10125 [candidate division WS1 bacterium]|jgi:hypothetical protein|nr:hypothetical protein [candidate division WS1 bacterium]